MSMTFRDDPSYYESCYRCGDDAIGMTGLCHSCHESAETVEECNPEDTDAIEQPLISSCISALKD